MKKAILSLLILITIPSVAQDRVSESNSVNITRQGFGDQVPFQMGLGFVNAKAKTDGSAYYFDDWDTDGIIYTKNKRKYAIKKVNINLYDNTLEAIYDENSLFTFDSESLVKIIINKKVFRVIKIDKELKVLEQFFSDGFSIYRYHSMTYSEGSKNPMVNRKTNKYIKRIKYYLYRNGKLTKIKVSKKSFAKLFESDTFNQEAIYQFIDKNELSFDKDEDLLKVFNFVSK